MRHKKPAWTNIGIDIDAAASGLSIPGIIAINDDATRWLKAWSSGRLVDEKTFIYLDPPYLMKTRKSGKLYNFEHTVDQHIDLLSVIRSLPCMVMISGYWSELYAESLAGWNCFSFEAQTRHGKATEWVWFNYPKPVELHDYRYLGRDFRERERIKRKIRRWVMKISKLPDLERAALFEAMAITTNFGERCRPQSPQTAVVDRQASIMASGDDQQR